MELKHLKYFVAVVEEGSITKAAQRLCIAQPPLSRLIQNLEEELDVKLFERGTRPVKTTKAGEFFYQHAVQILTHTSQATSMTKRIVEKNTFVRIGYVGSLLYTLLPSIIYLFKSTNPNVNVELIEYSTREQIDALKLGKIDLGFGRLRLTDPSVKQILLRKERLKLAIHRDHHLNSFIESGIHLSDFVNEPILLYPSTPKPNFGNTIEAFFTELGLFPKQTTEVREVHVALGLVAAGEGVCLVPETVSESGIKNIIYIKILDNEAYSPIFLSIRTMDKNSYLPKIIECINTVYKKENINNEVDYKT